MAAVRANVKAVEIKIEKDGIRAQVVRVLRQAIIAGDFLPGQRLVEADLCAALEISRPSLREALRHLESERLVQFIPNRGCFVAKLAWEDAEQIYQTRILLEPEVAALASDHADKESIQALGEALNQFHQGMSSSDKLLEVSASTHFYQIIADMAGNAVIKDILEGLNARINVLRARSMSHPARSKHSFQELTAIHDAIARHDAAAARAAARVHIENACAAAKAAMQATQ
ncbi:GntR family transcriptional regulator [Rhizobium puerariae]|uniref:GntR family transcriptional regulator n=1 Tax=Rhizobium puerariae TaxID=1585791 RepID=A0ABV6AJ98_9HYPH